MIVEKFKEIAIANGWLFNYGARDWQNLVDGNSDTDLPFHEKQKYFQLLWQDFSLEFNEYGATDGTIYDCEFIIAVRSDIQDEDYNQKYDENIKGFNSLCRRIADGINSCDGLTIKKLSASEIHNTFDSNLDGLLCKVSIEQVSSF